MNGLGLHKIGGAVIEIRARQSLRRAGRPGMPEQVMTLVVVFGGGGFLGRRLVGRLIAEGMAVRVAVRHPDPARIKLRSVSIW